MAHRSPFEFPRLGATKTPSTHPVFPPRGHHCFFPSLLPFGGVCGIPKVNLHEYVEKNRLPCIILLGEEKISFLSHFVPRLVAAVLEIQSPSCQRERERRERKRKKKRIQGENKRGAFMGWCGPFSSPSHRNSSPWLSSPFIPFYNRFSLLLPLESGYPYHNFAAG